MRLLDTRRIALFLPLLLLDGYFQAGAQNLSGPVTGRSDSSSVAGGSFKVGLNYNTGLNYFGRTDSLHSQGFYPSLEWDIKGGLFLSSDFILVNNSQATLQYAGTILEGGYKYTSPDTHFAASVFGAKFFYTQQSTLVQSALKGQVGVTISFLNEVLDVNLGGDANFSNETDAEVSLGVDHIIRVPNLFGNAVLVLDPSLDGYGGTQNYSTSYFQKINLLVLPIGQQAFSTQTHSFDLLAWQASLPVVLAVGSFDFILDPAWILPENVIDNSGNNTGEGKSLFYLTAGVTYTF